jgi:hypothetical protein
MERMLGQLQRHFGLARGEIRPAASSSVLGLDLSVASLDQAFRWSMRRSLLGVNESIERWFGAEVQE